MRPTKADKWLGALLFGGVGPLAAGFLCAFGAFVAGVRQPICWGTALAMAVGLSFFVLFGKLLQGS
jgi:hypothetical protein